MHPAKNLAVLNIAGLVPSNITPAVQDIKQRKCSAFEHCVVLYEEANQFKVKFLFGDILALCFKSVLHILYPQGQFSFTFWKQQYSGEVGIVKDGWTTEQNNLKIN